MRVRTVYYHLIKIDDDDCVLELQIPTAKTANISLSSSMFCLLNCKYKSNVLPILYGLKILLVKAIY